MRKLLSKPPRTRWRASTRTTRSTHNPMEMFATTVEWLGDGKKMKIYDKTQGAPNVQQYLLQNF